MLRTSYNILFMSAKLIFKSVLLSLMGTGVFFFFFMMAVIPSLSTWQRFQSVPGKESVVVDPNTVLRTYGIPLAGIAFVTLFFFALSYLRRPDPKRGSHA